MRLAKPLHFRDTVLGLEGYNSYFTPSPFSFIPFMHEPAIATILASPRSIKQIARVMFLYLAEACMPQYRY